MKKLPLCNQKPSSWRPREVDLEICTFEGLELESLRNEHLEISGLRGLESAMITRGLWGEITLRAQDHVAGCAEEAASLREGTAA